MGARVEATRAANIAHKEQADAFVQQRNATFWKGNLEVAKAKERGHINIANDKTTAARIAADEQVKDTNTTENHELTKQKEEHRVELELLKLQNHAAIDMVTHHSDTNISKEEFISDQGIQKEEVIRKEAEDRRLEAESEIARAVTREKVAEQNVLADNKKLAQLQEMPLPTMDELDPKGKDWVSVGNESKAESVMKKHEGRVHRRRRSGSNKR